MKPDSTPFFIFGSPWIFDSKNMDPFRGGKESVLYQPLIPEVFKVDYLTMCGHVNRRLRRLNRHPVLGYVPNLKRLNGGG